MTTLTGERCVACRRDSPRVTDAEMEELGPQIPGWNVNDSDGIPRLEKSFKFKNFSDALAFTTRLGLEADEEDHHPRITLEWGRVDVQWWTHAIRGLHRNDFVMAARTDTIYASASDDSL